MTETHLAADLVALIVWLSVLRHTAQQTLPMVVRQCGGEEWKSSHLIEKRL
ncbi:MAG: hypothetical protein AAB401_07455 [Acidobacteriota bacterium]